MSQNKPLCFPSPLSQALGVNDTAPMQMPSISRRSCEAGGIGGLSRASAASCGEASHPRMTPVPVACSGLRNPDRARVGSATEGKGEPWKVGELNSSEGGIPALRARNSHPRVWDYPRRPRCPLLLLEAKPTLSSRLGSLRPQCTRVVNPGRALGLGVTVSSSTHSPAIPSPPYGCDTEPSPCFDPAGEAGDTRVTHPSASAPS